MRSRSIVLAYHDLYEGEPRDVFSVSVARFREQLALLAALARGTVAAPPADDPYGPFRAATGGVLVTFDDGHRSDPEAARILSEVAGRRGVFFVTSGNVGRDGRWVSKDDVREIVRNGSSVQSHGHTHRFLTSLGRKELADELRRSREILEDLSGEEVRSISFPGGRYDGTVIREAASAGYRNFFTSRPRFAAEHDPDRGIRVYHRLLVRDATDADAFADALRGGFLREARTDAAYHLKKLAQLAIGDQAYQRLWELRQRGRSSSR